MSGFQKRVALLEKWVPSLLPQLKNIDDMAEIILDVWDEAQAHTDDHIIKLLEEHVWQLDVAPDGKWKQRCRCGFYGVFNDHLIELIKGETNG